MATAKVPTLADLRNLSNKQEPSNDDTLSTARSDVTEDVLYKELKMGALDVWALGITVVIGGQYFSWNVGLTAGFGTNILSLFFISSLYLCLILGNAELCSAFPFTGGAYGLGRLTLGLYWGFVVACCEAIEYIVYVASSSIALSDMLIEVSGFDKNFSLLFSFIFYATALAIHIQGGLTFSRTNACLAIVSLLILLLYCFGGLQYSNFREVSADPMTTGAESKAYFIGGMAAFMKSYPLAAWFYVGVESLNLATTYVPDARTMVPQGSIACMLTLMVTAILVIFVCSSVPPIGDSESDDFESTSASLVPFNFVFTRLFGISSAMATALSLPATYATAYGFIFAYGRLILSMARSGLFPPFLRQTYGPYETPYAAFIAGSVLGYGLCVLVYFQPQIFAYLFNVCMLSGFFEYLSQFVGYIVFIREHGTQERKFHSPFGIYGAVYGILVTLVGIVSIAAFQDDNQVALIAFLCVFVTISLYYHFYAKSAQTFSHEEKNVYFKCHVRGFNKRKMNQSRAMIKQPSRKFSRPMSEHMSDVPGLISRALSGNFGKLGRSAKARVAASSSHEGEEDRGSRDQSKSSTIVEPMPYMGLVRSASGKLGSMIRSTSGKFGSMQFNRNLTGTMSFSEVDPKVMKGLHTPHGGHTPKEGRTPKAETKLDIIKVIDEVRQFKEDDDLADECKN